MREKGASPGEMAFLAGLKSDRLSYCLTKVEGYPDRWAAVPGRNMRQVPIPKQLSSLREVQRNEGRVRPKNFRREPRL
jgi:hypothetical protein